MTHMAAHTFGRALNHGLGRSAHRWIKASLSAAAATLLLPQVAFGHGGHVGPHPVGRSGDALIPADAWLTVTILAVLVAVWVVRRRVHTESTRPTHRRPGLRSRALLAGTLAIVIAAPAFAADPNLSTPAPAPTTDPSEQLAGPTAVDPLGPNVLIYGPTSGGYADTTPGVNVTIWDEATWSSKATVDFAAFDAIVFGDRPICFGDPARWATAVANRQVWSEAITGNVIINGTDPDYHGKTQFVQQSVQFAASDSLPGPGLYVSLSCAYHDELAIVPVPLLGGLGEFTVTGVQNCPNDAHKVADHPALTGIDDTYLSNWFCSTHDIFNSWPTGYQPLAIIKDAQPVPAAFQYTATDGQRGHAYILASGASSSCVTTGDSDGDCLPDAVELAAPSNGGTGTDPNNPDTDGDGLLDSWEVTGVQGAGFHLPTGDATRDDVFGDYGPAGMTPWDCANQPGAVDSQRHVTDNFVCLNRPPDPNHKDVYIEIDWQDCRESYACPEIPITIPVIGFTFSVEPDDTHHAPDVYALADMVAAFAAAPVTNPDGTTGVNLRIVVDENIPHTPNCERGSVDRTNFGTQRQERKPATLAARAQAVRYVWSGHSSTRDAPDVPGCPLPSDFLQQGFGVAPVPDYDESPFGDANVGGRDVILTLGPLWSCSSVIGPKSLPALSGLLGPCFREFADVYNPFPPFGGQYPVIDPGIFPARVPTAGGERRQAYPLDLVMGMHEHDGIRQLWSRSLTHLLGHSLGIADEATVNNDPAPFGREQDAAHQPLAPLAPDGYDSWVGVRYAPLDQVGTPLGQQESLVNYGALATGAGGADSDPDNDGVFEDADNCPGIWNPDQANEDFLFQDVLSSIATNPGDACDQDIDGDGQINSTFGSLGSRSVEAPSFIGTMAIASDPMVDPFPFDTDNDGTDNNVDGDDDNDGVLDATDRCRLTPDPDQLDADGDGVGNRCDSDADGDGRLNALEHTTGSNALDAVSTPEYAGVGASCANGVDDDRDGGVDATDAGCQDTDSDGIANPDDNCPTASNRGQRDTDADGLGDACDLVARIDWVRFTSLPPVHNGTEFYWSATRAGTFSVRSGGSDCSTGTILDSGAYDPGPFDPSLGEVPASALAIVPASSLVSGDNALRVCVQAGADSASATTTITVAALDSTPPVSQAGPLDPVYSSTAVAVPYSASDDLSGVDHVELWWRYRATSSGAWGTWTLGPSATSSPITYTFASGDGYYEFYTIAIDVAGNREAPPASADAATQKTGRTAKSWGSNAQGQLGNGTTAGSASPVDVVGLTGITALGAGAEHSLAVRSDGTAWAWGQNAQGELGDGTTTDRTTPVQVAGLSGVVAVDGGPAHSLALKSDGTVWAWGLNNYGQLGDGTNTQRNTPVQVSGLSGVIAIAAGGDHSLALKSDGTVWAWGKNTDGQLGDGSKQKRSTPVRAGTLTGVVAIDGGDGHSLAVKSDGTVWAWGDNFYGQLGDGTTRDRTAPVQVSGFTGAVEVAAGATHSLARKSDGTAWGWGNNGTGQLGDGTTTERHAPVRVGTLTNLVSLAAGAHHALAVQSDGSLWAWGYNLFGQLGDGTTTTRTSPIQVSGVSGIATIAGGAFFSVAATGGGL